MLALPLGPEASPLAINRGESWLDPDTVACCVLRSAALTGFDGGSEQKAME